MSFKTLSVFIGGVKAGTLSEGDSGRLSFRYLPDYEGVPLSLSMPIGVAAYPDAKVRPYLMGLLPDEPTVRRDTARRYGVSGDSPFALLSHVGLECPGAVQVVSESDEGLLSKTDTLVPVSRTDIARRLSALNDSYEASWTMKSEHWSLGGAQGKIALRLVDGKWFRCEGSAATTHILKPGIVGLRGQALNEFACMRLASRVGLPAADVRFEVFEGEPAIVVKRFDRVLSNGDVLRLHQEDLCQALSVLPSQKYASDGGPSAVDVMHLLEGTQRAGENVRLFVAYLFFNYLVGGSDAHAKNYSIVFGADGDARLAPLYDVASIFPYMESDRDTRRMAMSIGGENRFGKVGLGAIDRMANAGGLDGRACAELMRRLAELVLAELDWLEEQLVPLPQGEELSSRLLPRIRDNAELTLTKLKKAR